MFIDNRYYNIINSILMHQSKFLLRDYQELQFIKDLEKKDHFISQSIKKSALGIQKELLLKNPAFGILFNGVEVKKSLNNQYWNLNIIDDILNFKNYIPLWGTHVSLIENKKVIFSYFYMPISNESWVFLENFGGIYNNLKIKFENYTLKNERIYGGNILMLYYLSVNKISKFSFELKNEFERYLIEFVLNLSKKDYKIENNLIICG